MKRVPLLNTVLLCLLMAGALTTPVRAQSVSNQSGPPELIAAQEVAGLVLGQMVSPLGHEFLSRFNEYWSEKQGYETITINISERFSRRAGSRVVIYYNGDPIYSGNIPFRSGLIRAFSAEVAEKVHANIAALSLKTVTQDPDIAANGF